MPNCSLCANPLPPDGGAVLFTDTRGIPFEVCGECEKRFAVLQTSRSQQEAEAALDYISRYAAEPERKDACAELMGYLGKDAAGNSQELEAEITEIREARLRAIVAGKSGKASRAGGIVRRVLFMIVGLLMLAALFYMIFRWF